MMDHGSYIIRNILYKNKMDYKVYLFRVLKEKLSLMLKVNSGMTGM